MAIVLPREESLGESLGTGLGQGLQILLSQQLQNIASRKQAQGLQALGIEPGMAQQLSQLDPSILREVVKERVQAPSQQAFSQALGSILGQPASPEARGLDALAAVRPPEEGGAPAAQTLIPGGIKSREAVQLAKLGLKQQELSAREQRDIDKETLNEYKTIVDEAKGARENDMRLDRMERLLLKGKLGAPAWASLVNGLEKIGIDASFILSPDAQEFKKLSNDFIKSAGSVFKGRITDNDIRLWLSTVPNLSQTDEGKWRVLENLRLFNEAAKVKQQAARDLIKENKGRRPRHFGSLVDERADQKLDEIAKRFRIRAFEQEGI